MRRVAVPRLGIDLRALAAFRILIGACLLLDVVLVRLPAVRPFYTDDGVFPRSALADTYPLLADLSIHALSGAVWFQLLLFVLLAIAATAIILGYRTDLAVLGAVVLLASMQARNPLVLSGGDTLMLVLLAVGLALPLDARWATRPVRRGGEHHVSVAGGVVLLLVAMILFTNGLLKLESGAWVGGTAVAQIGHVPGYWNPLGQAITDATALLVLVNWLWLGLLLASPLLVLLRGRGRTAVAGGLIAAQAGMAMTLWIGVFPLVVLAALVLYLPPPVWDQVEAAAVEPVTDRVRPGAPCRGGPESDGEEAPASVRRASPALPLDRPAVHRVMAVGLVALLIVLTAWQVTATGLVDAPTPELEGAPVDHSWAMFQHPPSANTWYVLEGELDSGATIDLRTGDEPAFDRPTTSAAVGGGWAWTRYGMQLRGGDDRLATPLAAYGCAIADNATAVTVVRIDQPIGPEGPTGAPTPTRVAEVSC